MFKMGIIGTGEIAHIMANTVKNMPDVCIAAVASRSIEKANGFATEINEMQNIPCKAYGSYEKLADDGDIDLIYIATPHSQHFKNMMLCIEKGKNVLCEKAFTVDAEDAEKVIEAAKRKGVFLAEAMWTRHMPLVNVIKRIAEGKVIGKVNMVSANMHFPMRHKERLLKNSLAGGALLDVGIYPLTIASLVYGFDVEKLTVRGKVSDEKVDENAVAVLQYKNGGMADINWGMAELSDCKATMYAEGGMAVIEGVNHIRKIDIFDAGFNLIESYEAPENEISGYEYEVMDCVKSINENRTESEIMSHETTLNMLKLMDAIREQLGVVYDKTQF